MAVEQPPPAPGRRCSPETPAAGQHGPRLTPETRALRDAWLAELWPTSRELPREEREIDRYLAAGAARHRGPGKAA